MATSYRVGETLIVVTILVTITTSLETEHRNRIGRVFSFFNVVKFPNDPCNSDDSNRQGTCFTQAECSEKGGRAAGTCAESYGVCCLIQLTCGRSSSENNTFMVQASSATPSTNPNDGEVCQYTICKVQPNICRIRFDLTVFNIGNPLQGTVLGNGGNIVDRSNAIGHCSTDSFVVSSPGNLGTPVICGINTGQHLFVDASDECSTATFTFGAQNVAREYTINVAQFECGSEMGGPPDCLQYHTANTGTFASFNFDTKAPAVLATATHLANQFYDICFRRNIMKCQICFLPVITNPAPGVNTQSSFGLGVSTAANQVNSMTENACDRDFLLIPLSAATTMVNPFNSVGLTNRFCGRVFSAIAGVNSAAAYAANAEVSVCTNVRPFAITFRTDGEEVTTAGVIPGVSDDSNTEEAQAPGGIIGFHLNYLQKAC